MRLQTSSVSALHILADHAYLLLKRAIMSFWQILARLAVSSEGETIQRVSDTTSVSSDGTTTQMGSTATGLGAVFNKPDDWSNSKADKFGMGDDNW